jgi:hypothetical protein
MFYGGTMKVDDVIYCDKCENAILLDPNPDRALNIAMTGGYGMFIDLEMIELLFCHSCVVELFRTIPSLSGDKLGGQHSVSTYSDDYPLCCEYSWTFKNDETVFGTKENFKGRE